MPHGPAPPRFDDMTIPTYSLRQRAWIFLQRFWQPTTACMGCMPGSFANLASATHWTLALQTGLAAGVLALIVSVSPLGTLYGNRWGNALLVGLLTAFADAWSHPNHFGFRHAEALLTGLVAAVLALGASYLFEDRARRIRTAWARLIGTRGP